MSTSALRKTASLSDATGRNKSSIRFDTSDDVPKVSNGTNWVPLTYVEVSYKQQPNGELADEAFFIASRAMQVVSIRQVHSTAGTNGSAVSLQVVKDTGTDAPGAGTNLLTNNSSAGFNLKGTANTVQTGTLNATVANLKLAAGDRLSVDFAGTLTDAAGVVVSVTLKQI